MCTVKLRLRIGSCNAYSKNVKINACVLQRCRRIPGEHYCFQVMVQIIRHMPFSHTKAPCLQSLEAGSSGSVTFFNKNIQLSFKGTSNTKCVLRNQKNSLALECIGSRGRVLPPLVWIIIMRSHDKLVTSRSP